MRIPYLNRIIGAVGAILVLLAFSACNPQNEAAGEAILTVSIEDATTKLIGPDAENVDISHYRITVSNDNGAIAVSELLPKNNAYTLTGLVPGDWDILAEGYVKPDASADAVKVAGSSESIQLTAGSNPVKITLDKLDETPAGTVSITLLLPPEAVSGSSFQYWYSVVDMAGEEAMSSGSEIAPLTGICTENTGSFDITGINQGSYLLFVSVNTSEGVVTAVDAMRLIAGLDAVGTLDFSGSSNTPTLDTGLTVEDAIGNILAFGDLDGTAFNITGADLEIGLPNAYEYHWYLDGSEWDGYVLETEKGTSETKFAIGNLEGISAKRHVLSVVAVIPGTQIGVGSVNLIVNKVGLAIEGDGEGIKIIPDGEFTVGMMAFKDSVFNNSIAFLFLDQNGEIISLDGPTGSDGLPMSLDMAVSPAALLQYAILCKELMPPDDVPADANFILDCFLEPFENGRLPSSFLSLPGIFFVGSDLQMMMASQLEMGLAQSGIMDYTKAAVCYNADFALDLSISETELFEKLVFSAENCGTLLFDSAPFEDNLSSFFSLFGQSLFSPDNENVLFFPFEIRDRNIEWMPEFLDMCGEVLREKNIRYKGLVISGEENIAAFKERVAAAQTEEDSEAKFDMLVSLVEENGDKIIDLPGTIGGTDLTAVVYPLIYMTGADGTEKFCYCFDEPQEINMTGLELKEITTDDGQTVYSVTGLKDGFVQPDSEEFVIPDSVFGIEIKEIESNAFKSNTGITGRLILPSSLKDIKNYAFSGCTGLSGDLVLPEGLEYLRFYVFEDCSGLTSVIIPGSVASIGYNAFDNCNGLKNVIIQNGVKQISGGAFKDCSNLVSISIPDSVTSFGASAFSGCSALASIDIPNSVRSFGESAFYGCSSLESVVIPDGVTGISYFTFSQCDSLTNIYIPNSVTIIGTGAFQDCDNLKNITIPRSIIKIDNQAFMNCIALEEIDIPDNVTSIGGSAFNGCSNLKSITIPNSVTEIGSDAFNGCSSLADITIPDSVISIAENAFKACSSLHTIFIPNSVVELRTFVFESCTSLADIYIEASSEPSSWNSGFWLARCNADVFWGISRAEYEAIMNNDSVPYEVPEPVISVNADVTISCDKAFAHIYYTTDGSEPTKDNGTLYEGPFSLADGFTVKAVAYVGNGIYSAVAETSGE